MLILHVTDLHFGVPTPPAEVDAGKLVLGSLGAQLVGWNRSGPQR
jgi:hypothetical protein